VGVEPSRGTDRSRSYREPARTDHTAWRRYLRFSVRGLILLVLVVGAGLGWIVSEARIQREVVSEIVKAGGNVTYDWQWSHRWPVPLMTSTLR
jgi:hypothetical protein